MHEEGAASQNNNNNNDEEEEEPNLDKDDQEALNLTNAPPIAQTSEYTPLTGNGHILLRY